VRLDDGTYLIRDANGFQSYFDTDGRLFSHIDRFDNIMLFEYDRFGNLSNVIDVYGREVKFFFDAYPDGVNRLARIRDFQGREVIYNYDGNGNLVSVRSPVVEGTSTGNDFPLGRTEEYAYSSGFANPDLNHNLLSCTMPQEVATGGPSSMMWTYGTNENDPATFDKVLSETIGGTNATGVESGGTRTFSYDSLNENEPEGQPELPRGKATIIERNGNVMEYFINERQHHILTRRLTKGLRPGEPAFFETQSFFDEDGLLERRLFPEGNEIQYVYDKSGPRRMQGNRLQIIEVADTDRGGGEDLVTSFTYEPLFNQVVSITDPRGNSPTFVPPLGVNDPDRYTTRFLYDYQESNDAVEIAELFDFDLSSIPRGLGGLNGDGRTDQAFGNMVRHQSPTVLLRTDSNQATLRGSSSQEVISEFQWNDRGQPLAEIDPDGNVIEYRYHPENDPDGDGIRTFSPFVALGTDPIGYRAESIQDARDSPRRQTVVDPLVLMSRFWYDEVGNLSSAMDPRGVLTIFEVNELNEVVSLQRGANVDEAIANQELLGDETAFAYETRFTYDHNSRVIRKEVENRDGNTDGVSEFVDETYVYDILDNLIRKEQEVDASTQVVNEYRYDENENLVLWRKPEQNETALAYDERDLTFSITRGSGTPSASTIQLDYDQNGNLIRKLDAEDNTGDGLPEATQLIYDGFNRTVELVDALGNQRRYSYDPADNLVRTQNFGHPGGQPEAANVPLTDAFFHYDELNRRFRTDEALFVSQGFNPLRAPTLLDENDDDLVSYFHEYDSLSRLTHTIEDDGETTETIYDGHSRVIGKADAAGNMFVTDYDSNSNPVRVTSVEKATNELVPEEVFETLYVYDQLNRLVRATDNAGQTARFSYDSRDNLVFRSDPEGALVEDPLGLFPGQINEAGNTHTYIYDGLDRRVAHVSDLRIDGSGNLPVDVSNPFNNDGQVRVNYIWDGNSRQIGMEDDIGNLTSYEYDSLDRIVSQVNAKPDEVTNWVYDRDDNMVEVTDPNGSLITRSFDALNRLVSSQIDRAAGVGGTVMETFEHDGLSRVTGSVDSNSDINNMQIVEIDYDSLSRIIEERFNGQPMSTVFAGDGRRIQSTYPGGRVVDRTFDSIDRIIGIQDITGTPEPIASSDWIGQGMRELRRQNGNGTTLSFLNDAQNADVGYDAIQRIQGLQVLGQGGAKMVQREYGYNRADRMLFESRVDDGNLTDRYTYDSLYRLTDTDFDQDGTGSARNIESFVYEYDGVGNRRSVASTSTNEVTDTIVYLPNAVNEYTEIDSVTRQYSLNGNLLDDGSRSYVYDFRNRLVEVVENGSGSTIAEYRYFTDNRRAEKLVDGIETRFVYDGWQVCEEQNGGGETLSTYVYSPSYDDAPIQLKRTADHPLGEATVFLHQDARSNVVAATDGSGAVIERLTFDDFGQAYDTNNQPVPGSSTGNPYGFQARRMDPETGLLYFRNRYYDPQAGRFIQRDPVYDPVSKGNQYTFVGNSPLSRRDPYGDRARVNQSGDHTDISVDVWKNGKKIGILTASYAAASWTGKFGANGLWEDACTVLFGTQGELTIDFQPGSGIPDTDERNKFVIDSPASEEEARDTRAALAAFGIAYGEENAENMLNHFINESTKSGKSTSDTAEPEGEFLSLDWENYSAATQSCNDFTDAMLDVWFGENWNSYLLFDGGNVMDALRGKKNREDAERELQRLIGQSRGGGCFVAGTPVWTVDGLKPIEEIKKGDRVLAWEEAAARRVYHPVTQLIRAERVDLLQVSVVNSGEPIVCSSNHRFFTREGGWKPASDLCTGDEVFNHSQNAFLPVLEVIDLGQENPVRVYNFTVDSAHTYFVGEEGILVHNVK
jgi:RHS repeat-associated protein